MQEEIGTRDTFPKLLLHHARERGDSHPAIREKAARHLAKLDLSEVAGEIEALASGLARAGLVRGAHIAVIGANRPRLYWTLTAAQCLGAIPVPFYEDAIASEMVYVFQDAEIAYAVVEDQEQADKLLEILPQCPKLKHVWYDDPRWLAAPHYTQPELASYEEPRRRGTRMHWRRSTRASSPRRHRATARATTRRSCSTPRAPPGIPKGVVLSHDEFRSTRAAPTR